MGVLVIRVRALLEGGHKFLLSGLGLLFGVDTWTSKMAKIMDPILPVLSIWGYWAIVLGFFGGSGNSEAASELIRS